METDGAGLVRDHPSRSNQVPGSNAGMVTKQYISRNEYPCYGGVVVAGSAIDITSPVIDMHMFH